MRARENLSGRSLSRVSLPLAVCGSCRGPPLGLHCASVTHTSELLSARSSHRRSVLREIEVA
jgi:hypothetical protein